MLVFETLYVAVHMRIKEIIHKILKAHLTQQHLVTVLRCCVQISYLLTRLLTFKIQTSQAKTNDSYINVLHQLHRTNLQAALNRLMSVRKTVN